MLKVAFNPADWYWRKDGAGEIFSSKAGAVVPATDPGFLAWTEDGSLPTVWPRDASGAQTAAALHDVLAPYGIFSDLATYAAAKRYEVETAGIQVGGASIATDRQSQAMIGNAYAYVQASDAQSVAFKSLAGFVTLTADQIKAIALAVGAHVQACFAAEAAVVAGIAASPPTIATAAQVDAEFSALSIAAP